jgi:hypothetical protein
VIEKSSWGANDDSQPFSKSCLLFSWVLSPHYGTCDNVIEEL